MAPPLTGSTRICNCCGKKFYVEAWRVNAKYCSRKCWNKKGVKRGRQLVTVTCEFCNKKYEVSKWYAPRARFCSYSCGAKGNKKLRIAQLKAVVTHGMKGTPEFRCWCAMKSRCKGGWYLRNGISVCPEWQTDFMAFYNYLGPIPGPHYTVDRYPNNLGNYEPGNIRWATKSEQGWSKRGKTHSLEWKRQASLRSRGENSPTAKLTEDDVRAIRALTGTETRAETGFTLWRIT